MQQLERLGGAPLCTRRERISTVFADDAGVAESFRLVQDGETMDKSLPAHLVERAEVGVPKARVPAPRVLSRLSGQADRTCNGEVEHIQSPWPPSDLGEKTVVFVADAHHAGLDQDLLVLLIQLPIAHNVGREVRDEEGVGEGAVFAVLALEEHGAAPLDAHR
jgi:hypothetical protein